MLRAKLRLCRAGKSFSSLRHAGENDGVFAISYPGSRVLELSNPEQGNELTALVTTALQEKLKSYESNVAVSALFFTSRSVDVFSTAVVGTSLKDKNALQSLSNFVLALSTYEKPTLSVYSGRMNGTAYAAFAGSKYLLGGPSLSLVADELSLGKIPSAGFAFRFKKCGPYGMAMARYLAVSKRDVRADDLFGMGLLTHLVDDEAHVSLADALAHTIPTSTELENTPGVVVAEESLNELLNTMHVLDDLDWKGEIDPMSHKMWDKLMLVPPNREDTKEADSDDADPNDLSVIKDDVLKCFSCAPEMSIRRLSEIKAPWATDAAEKMSRIDGKLLGVWWRITDSIDFPGIRLKDILTQEVAEGAKL